MKKLKKLKLKQEVIASLNDYEMNELKGGASSYICQKVSEYVATKVSEYLVTPKQSERQKYETMPIDSSQVYLENYCQISAIDIICY